MNDTLSRITEDIKKLTEEINARNANLSITPNLVRSQKEIEQMINTWVEKEEKFETYSDGVAHGVIVALNWVLYQREELK